MGMHRHRRILNCLTLCLAVNSAAVAATFKVDSEASIANAIANAGPGDVIEVANGTYTFPVRINGRNGTAANPITFKSESIGGVTFTGSDLSDRTKLRVERDHWVIDGFKFQNIKVPGTTSSDQVTVVRVRGASDNVLRNLSIDDCGLSSNSPHSNAANNSMYVDITDTSARNVVERSEFLNNSRNIVVRVAGGSSDLFSTDNVFRYNYWSGNGGYETLQLSWGSSSGAPFRTIVEHNLWKDNASSSELISSKSSENVFRHNTFDHNIDQLTLRGGNHAVVDSNYFLDGRGIRAYGAGHTITNNYMEGSYGPESGNLKGGLLLGAGDDDDEPYAPFRDGEVRGNTIVNTGDFSLLYGMFYDFTWNGSLLDVPPHDNVFGNNLIANSAGQAINREKNAPDSSNTWSDNYVWSTGAGSAGYAPPGVSTTTNPEFERDFLGNLVPSSLEEVGANMQYRSLTVEDVGPGSTYVAGLAGDYNQNGTVDSGDYDVWRQLYGSNQLTADGNLDGSVSLADFTVWRDQLAITAAISKQDSVTVPTPSSVSCCSILSAALVVSRRIRSDLRIKQ